MPAHTLTPSIVLDRVSFAWPDGSPALDRPLRRLRRRPHRARRPQRLGQVHAAAADRRRARRPSAGNITTSADVAYLPQRLTLDVDRPVAELLGVSETLGALRAIESGDVDPRHFDASAPTGTSRRASHAALAEAGLAPEHARPPGRRALRRRGGAHRDRRDPAARSIHRPARRADQQPRPGRASASRGHGPRLARHAHRGEPRRRRCSSSWTTPRSCTRTSSASFGGPYSRVAGVARRGAGRGEAGRGGGGRGRAPREARSGSRPRRTIAHRQAMGRKAQFEKRVPPIVAGNLMRSAQVSAGKLRTETPRQGGGGARRAGCGGAAGARRRHRADRPARPGRARRAPDRDDRRRRRAPG